MVGFLSSTVPDQSKTMPAKQVLPARKRKRPIDEDSTEATSAKSSTKHTHSQASNSVLQPTHLGQAYLTFGSKPLHITCKKCGMQYTKLSSEDGSLHAQYCKKAAGPIQWHPPANEMSPDTRAVILRRKTKNTLSSLQGCIAIIPYKEAGKAVQAKVRHYNLQLSCSRSMLMSPTH